MNAREVSIEIARELAMDGSHIPMIAAIVEKKLVELMPSPLNEERATEARIHPATER